MSDSATVVSQIEGTYRASDGWALHTYAWSSNNLGTRSPVVVIMHGYAEHVGRYREFAEYLVRSGNRVCGFDARGHGKSPGQRGHIPIFDRYVEDLHGFTQSIRREDPDRPIVMLGHSNGGLSALRVVQTRRHAADGLILSCPLIALQRRHTVVPVWLASILASFAGRLPLPNGIDGRELTHDAAIREVQEHDPLNHGLTTPRWYVTVHGAMKLALASLDAVRLPALVLEADSDPIVVPQAVSRLYDGLASPDKELIVARNSYHEILNEVGRAETYRQIAAWLAARWKESRAA